MARRPRWERLNTRQKIVMTNGEFYDACFRAAASSRDLLLGNKITLRQAVNRVQYYMSAILAYLMGQLDNFQRADNEIYEGEKIWHFDSDERLA